MQIQILEFVGGAINAQGLTVIIDVFRAFSLEAFLFNQGAKKVIPVADVNEAFALKKSNKDFILIGERLEKKVPGFDFGNSPTAIKDYDFSNKTFVHTTSAGTLGLVNAMNASEIITGSFVNISAIIQYIKDKNPKMVSLVAMGFRAESTADEDILCAQYIKNELEGKSNNFKIMVATIKMGTGARFFDPINKLHSPPSDFDLCLEINKFSFVIKAERIKDKIELRKIPVNINCND